ncbi:hypothetical protein [Stomatobaculum longum]|uniref:hypothetical protein n=1 Tax=Stomatobaculum longum TaxID=796942 RepID=UPI0028042F18|nr:hypothetical protein [Stomatobaculum longum]
MAFLKIPSMKKQKGKLPPQLAKSLTYPWRVSKKKILPLSAYSGLRGVVGNRGEILKISVHFALRGVVGSERKIFKICRNSG